MEIIDLQEQNSAKPTFVALGNFDGVHLGHKILIEKVIEESRLLGVSSSILLFTNHTKNVLNERKQELLTTTTQKLKIFKDLGVDLVFEIPFTEEFMKLSPESFVKEILVNKLCAKGVVVGFDYRFGYKASGDEHALKELSKKYHLKPVIIPPIFINHEIISSTIIRQAIKNGNMEKANYLLGRTYSISGIVGQGKQYGQTRGVPTANLKLKDNYVIPKSGVYDSKVIINSKSYKAATSVGSNPTFNEKETKIEVHALDFSGDIYGETITIEFLEFLRPEINFSNKDALYEQINLDISRIRARLD